MLEEWQVHIYPMHDCTGTSDDCEGLAPFAEIPYVDLVPRQMVLDGHDETDWV
jgi:hypothetical protein